MKICSRCGKQIDERVRFCPSCGEKQDITKDRSRKGEKATRRLSVAAKKIFIAALCACVAAGTFAVLLFGRKDSDKEMAKQQLEIFLDGYQQRDDTISGLLIGTADTDKMSFEGISGYFADELEYQIQSCESGEEGQYIVTVQVQNIDFERVFSDSYQMTLDKYGEDEIADRFLDEMEQNLKQKNYETGNFTCDVAVRKMNDGYKIQMNSSFANALTGGMHEYLDSLRGGE